MMILLGPLVMTAAASAAAVMDLRTRRIPNALTGALAAFAIALHAANGPIDAVVSICTILVVFALGTAAFTLGWFGGGDVKLVAACAGVVGPAHLLLLLCFIGIAGGAVGLVYAARLGRIRTLLNSSALALAGHAPVARVHLPYGVAIAIGSLAYSAFSSFVH